MTCRVPSLRATAAKCFFEAVLPPRLLHAALPPHAVWVGNPLGASNALLSSGRAPFSILQMTFAVCQVLEMLVPINVGPNSKPWDVSMTGHQDCPLLVADRFVL